MANFVTTDGLNDLNFQISRPVAQTRSRIVDFAKFTLTGVAGAAADTADVITLPANFVVMDVKTIIVTASTTASSVFGVGDSASSVGFMPNTTAATSAVGTVVDASGANLFTTFATTPAVTAVISNGKTYATANAIRVVLGATAPLNGKVKVIVYGFQIT